MINVEEIIRKYANQTSNLRKDNIRTAALAGMSEAGLEEIAKQYAKDVHLDVFRLAEDDRKKITIRAIDDDHSIFGSCHFDAVEAVNVEKMLQKILRKHKGLTADQRANVRGVAYAGASRKGIEEIARQYESSCSDIYNLDVFKLSKTDREKIEVRTVDCFGNACSDMILARIKDEDAAGNAKDLRYETKWLIV